MNRSRTISAILGASLALTLAVGPAAANHTDGILDCGAAGTYHVEAASTQPLPKFESPLPWSGLFLLEDTNRVFRAFYLATPRSLIVEPALYHNPKALIECTLASSGFNFEEPWVLVGMLVP
jgi:hypothetical protein